MFFNNKKLAVGDEAPEFTALDQAGNEVKLSDFIGKKEVILYFYPKDNTPGCTKQACHLRDTHEEIRKKNFVVLGISSDSVATHKNFSLKYGLPFKLLSDQDKTIRKKYGATTLGFFPSRVTFVIDKTGKIRQIIHKVNTSDHFSQIAF